MILAEVLKDVECKFSPQFKSLDVPAVWDDSRRVTPGSLFAAIDGPLRRGEEFVEDAIKHGAQVLVVNATSVELLRQRFPLACLISVSDPYAAFRKIVRNVHGNPSSMLKVLGVTGTNGKTTITYFLESILKAAGKLSAVVGTVNYRVGKKVIPSKNTTPGFLDNQLFLASLLNLGVDYAVMEVSSHALHQGRVDMIDFKGGVFTNLTGDHLDYHKTMEAYFQAKSLLFKGLKKSAYAVLNVDDEYGRRLLSMTQARTISYGLKSAADVTAEIREFDLHGTHLVVSFAGSSIELKTHFIGYHNIYNMLAAFAAGIGEGFDLATIKRGIESLEHVPGRLERVPCKQGFSVFIDYAHTDDGLKNVLECLNHVPHRRLIVVFGCGGERDKTKRPRMGRVASELADYAILTSDNPRSEDPAAIIEDIKPGFTSSNYETIVDRETAIARALELAQHGDIVLLAGKGHETYQVLKDKTIEFVERDIVTRILSELKTDVQREKTRV